MASYEERTEVDNTPEGKVTILPGATADLSAASYCIMEEDHTLGNLLRWMIMKNPDVEFCGYSAPHPSEAKIHIRIQMYDGKSSFEALETALNNLEDMTLAVEHAYKASLASGDYERTEDNDYSFEAVNDRLWAAKEAAGRGTRAEFEQKRAEAAAEAEKEKEKLAKPKKGKPIKVGK